ncbi:MAG: coenzyme F420-0:L-glutamate ligase [Candidatus Dojkabacteria bacterium]
MKLPSPNSNKKLEISIGEKVVKRYPVRTKLIVNGDDVVQVVSSVVNPLKDLVDDGHRVVVVGEKAVAASQGRAFLMDDIKPSKLAKFLARFVTKTKAGIGLGMPETMELALKDVGVPRIVLAFFVAAVTKPLGIKGMFYRVAGSKARGIDGPTPYTIPPYNQSAVLVPDDPGKVAKQISKSISLPVVIIDANDIGQNVLASYGLSGKDTETLRRAFADNPLGQSTEQTPVALVTWND